MVRPTVALSFYTLCALQLVIDCLDDFDGNWPQEKFQIAYDKIFTGSVMAPHEFGAEYNTKSGNAGRVIKVSARAKYNDINFTVSRFVP